MIGWFSAMPAPVIRFDRFELDLADGRLRAAEGDLELPRLSRRLLGYLAANRERVVPFDEVRAEVWDGVKVGEAAMHQALRQVRRALGDDARRQRFIRTVRSVGYRFVAEVESEPAPAAASGHAYVGRAELLAELDDLLTRALAGQGGIALLSGDPGVGKTRTMAEITRAAESRGALALRAGGTAHTGAPPFWPWLPLFEALAAQRPVGELQRELDQLAASVAAPGGADGTVARLDDVSRFRFFDAASRALGRASAHGPLVLCLDDLHEVGSSALELLEHVGRSIGGASLLILGAYRPDEALRSPERARALAAVLQRPDATSLELRPLDVRETTDLVLAHQPPDRSERFLSLLARQADGNPFYAIELTRFLRSTIRPDDAASMDWESRIPQGVQQILAARLAGLTADAWRVIEAYACLGGEFDPEVLAVVEPGADVAESIEEARALDLLAGDPPRFVHPLIREAVLARDRSDADGRRRLHLRIALTLEQLHPDRIGEAAFHFGEAAPLGGVERAVDRLRHAGERAERQFDDEGAWQSHRKALRLLDRWPVADDALRCEILIAAGEIAVRGTRVEEARGLLREASAIGRRLGVAELFCRAVLAFAYRDEMAEQAEGDVVELLQEALALGTTVPPAIRARLLSGLARRWYTRPDGLKPALAMTEEAGRLARRAGDPRALAQVLEDTSHVRWSVADPEGWIDLNREIVRAASEAGDPSLVFRGVKGIATGLMEVGDRNGMEREFGHCAALAAEAPAPFLVGVSALHGGAVAFLDGRFDEAESLAIRASASGLPAVTPLAAVQLFYHRLETGRIAELEASVRSTVEASPALGAWRFALARLLAAEQRHDEAAAQLAEAQPIGELARDRFWLAAATLCAEVVVEIGDARRADALFSLLEPHARVGVALGHGALFYGSVSHFLGMLATTLGRYEESARLLDLARGVHEQMRSEPWRLRTRLAMAENAAARGNRDAAQEGAREVLAHAERAGLVRLAARARTLASP